ncbi:LuxR family transcriptional regulator [Kutzneria buriramensis]|uniref:helix-turn-helix transcriptional regulator n=1 Tax=Kutzneria buriramensis TaxID=1045776 RepID=UPI001476F2F6|nr:LuxR family transcriptional regulator [Kutzneria buriramensis]
MLIGRGEILAALDSALDDMADAGGLVLVQGDVGSGKTAVLAEVERVWSDRGMEVVTVPLGDTPAWDLFGAQAMVSAVRDRFERVGDRRLADALTGVTRLCTAGTYLSRSGRSALTAALTGMFACLRRGRQVAVLIDDVHALASPLLGVAAACRAGCVVVATYVEEHAVAELTPVIEVAERRLDLAPLGGQDVEVLVAAWAGVPVDPAVLPAIRASLGPLAGNPATLLAVLRALRDQDRFTELRGVLCLREKAAPIALPTGHWLVRRVEALGDVSREVVAMVGQSERLRVDDLCGFAAVIDRGPSGCGGVLDQLVRLGALEADPSGRLHCPCPALAVTVAAGLGRPAVRQLHRAFAEYLLRDEHVDCGVLAHHVLQAGSAMPRVPAIVDLLAVGDRIAVTRPEQSARLYHAALLHADREHPAAGRITSSLLRLLVRIGRFDWLGEVVEDVAAERAATHRVELACAATLAALHTGRPVSGHVRAVLSGTPGSDRPLQLGDRWFAADPGISAEDVAEAFEPFVAAPTRRRHLGTGSFHDELLVASTRFDLVTVFQNLFGAAYHAPVDGPLAAYHRVLAGYISGQWDAALSAATDLDLTTTADTPSLQLSRLFAAEICAYRGEYKQARSWLAEVPDNGGFIAARGWVEIGMLVIEGDRETAFRQGVRLYALAQAKGEDFAMALLLLRLAGAAFTLGLMDWAQRVLADAEELYRRQGDRASHCATLMMRGLVSRDADAAQAAVALARFQGYKVQLAQACLVAATVAADPQPLLHEAHSIATELGAEAMRTLVRTVMRHFGVFPPRTQASGNGFSDIEVRIIELVRDGRTNRQIAVRLRVSERTVENHLSRLFLKTGCRSRVDLATASVAGRLSGT